MNNNIQCSIESSTTSMELNSAADGIFLVPELEGLAGLPEIRTTSGVNAGYDGGWTSAQNYDARLIAIRGVIADKDIAKVEATRRKLASLLGQGRKEQLTLHFTTEAGNAYTISVRTISCEMALQRVLNKQDFLIQLRADDPLIYDDGASGGTEAILRVQQALGGFEINFGLPLAIGGSSDATAVENGAETVYPIIKLYGPLHSPTVVNMTTNQQMQIIADLGYTITWSGWTGVSGERLSIPNELDKEAPLRLWSVDGNTIQDGTPTPSAPVPVQTVTGRQTVTVTGKNLFNKNATLSADRRISTSNGNTYTSNGYTISDYTQVQPSTTYTLSAGITSYYSWYKADKTYISGGAWGNQGQQTAPSGAYYVRFDFQTSNVDNVQLELGNQATAYEAYRAQEYEINLGKNLFDKDNAEILHAYNGNSRAVANERAWSIILKCEPNTTYTYSNANSTTAMLNDSSIGFYATKPVGGTAIINRVVIGHDATSTFTTPATAEYMLIYYYWGGDQHESAYEQIQIEKGSQVTDYSVYLEPIELCKIGTYQDRIYKENGKWWLHKEVGKAVLNGSETWTGWQQSGGLYRANTILDGSYVFTDDARHATRVQSSHFTSSTTNNYGIVFQYRAETLFYPQSGITSLADFKTWLGTALPSVYYVLATPTTTEITNEEVLEGLEALGDATLYVGTNNIYTDTPSALPTLEVDYPTDYDETHDTVIIDSQARTITLNGADIYHLKTEESEFPVLAPGENRMYLTSATTSDTGYAEVKFKQGYLSI